MLVRYSILAAASGSVGGVTASHGRSGQHVRARVVPVDPRSPFQSQVRIIFGNLSIAWQTLSLERRDAWATYAANVPVRNRLGDAILLTGHAMYIRNNVARLQAGLPRVDVAPTVFSTAILSPIDVLPRAASQSLFLTVLVADPWTTTPGAIVVVSSTRQASGTVRFRRTPYRPLVVPISAVIPPPPHIVSIATPFPLNANGSNAVFVRFVALLPDGRISPPLQTGPFLIVPA